MRRLGIPSFAVFLLSALALVPAVASAQGFQAVTTKDGTDVWAVGDNGVVYRSLVGGTTFASSQLGIRTLRAITHRGLGVIVVGDSGYVFRSADNGLSFTTQAVPGAPVLRAVSLASATRAYAAGDGGAILRSDDAGATWAPQSSGTVQALYALAFSDADHGFAAGAGGTLLSTSDGGANWSTVSLSTGNTLLAIARSGSTVWVGGAGGTLLKSTNGGSSFSPVNLRADFQPDVRALSAPGANDVWVGGGGGFVRHSTDGGTTWQFPVHEQYGPTSGIAFTATAGFAVSSTNRIVTRWNGGSSMLLPASTTLTRTWSKTMNTSGTQSIRGRSLAVHPLQRDVIYDWSGDSLYRSPDGGETWRFVRRINNSGHVNAFTISGKDTLQMVAAIVTSGGSRQVWRTTDGGVNWTPTLTHAFGEYGIPLERHPDKPDTLLFGGDSDSLMRSVDG
nr:hypothetical protein [Candidatus Eisenbacteria bacterium]